MRVTNNAANCGASGAAEPGLFELVYVSRAVERLDQSALEAILRTARSANAEASVTGMLLYRSTAFLQVLEGTEATVRALYDRIRADRRHFRVRTLIERPLAERRFPEWSMGFRRIDETDELPGFSHFLEESTIDLTDAAASEALEMLYVFRAQA
jgi:hypothetical protein